MTRCGSTAGAAACAAKKERPPRHGAEGVKLVASGPYFAGAGAGAVAVAVDDGVEAGAIAGAAAGFGASCFSHPATNASATTPSAAMRTMIFFIVCSPPFFRDV